MTGGSPADTAAAIDPSTPQAHSPCIARRSCGRYERSRMDSATFKARSERLLEVAKLIEKIPAEIRAQAFSLVAAYVTGKAAPDSGKAHAANDDGDETVDTEDRGAFFTKFTHDKPSDNIYLIAAYWYGQHGIAPFTVEGIRKLAGEVGVTIP